MRGSLRLCRVFGIGVYVHWTFLFLPLIVASGFWDSSLQLKVYMELLVVLVFTCVVLHELGHALMAKFFGIPTLDITLLPIGGLARLGQTPDGRSPLDRPMEEFWIALAGPAVNVVIGTILFGILYAVGAPSAPGQILSLATEQMFEYPYLEQLGIHLLLMNIMLVVFNMVPAFPLDGGRVFRALLATELNQVLATQIAAYTGMLVAGLMGLLGLIGFLFGGGFPMILLVSLFIIAAGQMELASVRHRAALQQMPPFQVVSIPPGHAPRPPEPGFTGFTFDENNRVWLEWHDGRAAFACKVNPYSLALHDPHQQLAS